MLGPRVMRFLPVVLVCVCSRLVSLPSPAADAGTLVEADLPALSREWTGDDYTRAAQILAAGTLPLPSLSDEQGRLFLKRLTATDNLAFYRNRTLPIEARVESCFKLMEGAGAILKLYGAAANKGQRLNSEITQQTVFMLHLAAVGIQLIDEFMPTVPKDEKYAIRIEGVKKTYAGLTRMFVGAEASLSEKSFYSSENLSDLLTAMAETLPRVEKAFSPDFKVELRKKLESRKAAFPGKRDEENIQRMIDELGA
jgi:hypothetical protein